MSLEDRLERLAHRAPSGDPAEVMAAARSRAESPPDVRSPRLLAAAAAAVLAVVALTAGGLALTGGEGTDSVTAGPGTADIESLVAVPDSGASAQQLADGTPVWVVRHDDGSVSVLDAVSTHRPFGAGTLVGWCDSSRGFLDPMYGSGFDEHGRKQAGPAPTGLDSYPVASVDGDTATVTGPPVEQPRAEAGGPDPSEPAGPDCLDLTTGPVPGYLPGSFDLHPYDTQTPVNPEDAVREPDGTYVLVDAPVVIVKGEQPLVCTSPVEGASPSCEGVPAPGLFLHDQEAAVVSGPFIARPKGGALVDIAYVGERTVTDGGPAEGGGGGVVHDVDKRGGVDGPVLYGPEQHGLMQQAIVAGRLLYEDDCLYLLQEGDEALYAPFVVVWPNGTTWQHSPEGVRLPDGKFVPVEATVTASGGFDDAGSLVERGHAPAVAERARACAFDNIDTVAYVQGEVTVGDVDPVVEGDTAVWDVGAANPPTASATAITVLVTRLGCNGGETGEVFDPAVSAEGGRVVITFSVEPVPGGDCPGNNSVPYVVQLDEPLRDRELVDGACLSGKAASTSHCSEGAVRWRP